MRILTVRQPWAWAIIHGGKDIENRVRNIAGDYRGPVAIQAALEYDTAWSSPAMYDAMQATGMHRRPGLYPWHENHGAIIGVVDLVGVHPWDDPSSGDEVTRTLAAYVTSYSPCSPWAEERSFHLMLEYPRALEEPIPFKGALGLRRLDDEMVARIEAAIV